MIQFIEFKTIPKKLKAEGITIDLLHQVQMHGKLSPVQLMKDEAPVKTIPTQNGSIFFIMVKDGQYLKCTDNQTFIKEKRKNIIIARARYLLNYLQDEIDSQIDNEVLRIKKNIDKEFKQLSDKFKQICEYADYKESSLLRIVYVGTQQEGLPPQVIQARKFFEVNDREAYQKYINSLSNAHSMGNYDTLYHVFNNKGLPLIASFNHNDFNEMSVLKKLFSKDNIPVIAEELEADSIRVIARINIEKKYAIINN